MILPKGLRGLALVLIHSLAPQSATPALAQVEAISPEGCVGIDSDAERLACYDRAVGRARRPGGIEEAPPARPPRLSGRSPETPPPTSPSATFVGPPPPAELMARPVGAGGVGEEGPPVASSLLDSRWELTRNAKLGTFGMRAYKPVYLLPAFYTDSPNQFPSSPEPGHSVTESETPGRGGGEVPDQLQDQDRPGALRRPRRPLVRLHAVVALAGLQQRAVAPVPRDQLRAGADARLPHALPSSSVSTAACSASASTTSRTARTSRYSRSWNRVIGMIGFERDAWTLIVRPWWRLPEVAGGDDNPDIEDYVGRGDLLLVRRLREHEISLMARHSLRGGESSHGAVELGWVFPIHRDLKGYLQIFHGYGESLIDYNQQLDPDRPRHLAARMVLRAGLLALTLLVAACGPAPPPRPPADNSLTVALESAPIHLDPRVATDQASSRVFELILDGLVTKDESGDFLPDLAESWEALDVGARWRFHLRPGVRFHDGSTFEAEDVVWTFETLLDGTVTSSKRGAFAFLQRVVAIDPATVDFVLSEPFGALLPNLTSYSGHRAVGRDARSDEPAAGRHRPVPLRRRAPPTPSSSPPSTATTAAGRGSTASSCARSRRRPCACSSCARAASSWW